MKAHACRSLAHLLVLLEGKLPVVGVRLLLIGEHDEEPAGIGPALQRAAGGEGPGRIQEAVDRRTDGLGGFGVDRAQSEQLLAGKAMAALHFGRSYFDPQAFDALLAARDFGAGRGGQEPGNTGRTTGPGGEPGWFAGVTACGRPVDGHLRLSRGSR